MPNLGIDRMESWIYLKFVMYLLDFTVHTPYAKLQREVSHRPFLREVKEYFHGDN